MKVEIGNLQVAVWQTEEALDLKRLDLESEDDGDLIAVLVRSVAGLESLLAIQRCTLDFLVRQDGLAPTPPPSETQALSSHP